LENSAVTSITASYLGTLPYISAWELQETLRKNLINGHGGNQLLIVQHPPTISLGRGEKGANLHFERSELQKSGFDVVETNRGGKVTYHGPGQLVAYPVVDLRTLKRGVKTYVQGLEDTMIQTLNSFGIGAERRESCPGAWVSGKKIGSIGIHVRKQVSVHGLALNVSPDLSHFSVITPCGITGVTMTSICNEGVRTSVEEVIPFFLKAFADVFQCRVTEASESLAANV
jgi:lipoate-protein ligase B